jgi:rhodanese-related sulfurtransferase
MTASGPQQLPTTAVELLPDPLPTGITVLDVREPEEWDAGHIEGAVHVPLSDLPGRFGELDGEDSVLCVCHVGARSAQAVLFLRSRGLSAVNLHGGMLAWSAAGRPVVGAANPPPPP